MMSRMIHLLRCFFHLRRLRHLPPHLRAPINTKLLAVGIHATMQNVAMPGGQYLE
jgi:hypothetical protein